MADITMMRGYGFPRGGAMDYAGYGNYRAPQRSAASRIPYVPEPSIFAKIPALDGLGEDFGTEYVFTRRAGYGDMVLPTLDIETGQWEQPAPPTNTNALLGIAAVGVGLLWLFGR